MKPFTVALCATLVVALGVLATAIRAGSDASIAWAAIAVVAGSLLLVVSLALASRHSWSRRTTPPLEVNALRAWIRSGELGHEEIVRLLDRIDRMGPHPELGVRTEPEMARYRAMSRADFLEAVAARLDEIEGAA